MTSPPNRFHLRLPPNLPNKLRSLRHPGQEDTPSWPFYFPLDAPANSSVLPGLSTILAWNKVPATRVAIATSSFWPRKTLI